MIRYSLARSSVLPQGLLDPRGSGLAVLGMQDACSTSSNEAAAVDGDPARRCRTGGRTRSGARRNIPIPRPGSRRPVGQFQALVGLAQVFFRPLQSRIPVLAGLRRNRRRRGVAPGSRAGRRSRCGSPGWPPACPGPSARGPAGTPPGRRIRPSGYSPLPLPRGPAEQHVPDRPELEGNRLFSSRRMSSPKPRPRSSRTVASAPRLQ